ncbi:MAG: cyclic nucleotide-binding domain-containing protein [Spirochaetales bacterium]|nr:cyclic nucleotide-binding domain-containing protein [Spirochaetales bacterium]
MAENVLFDKYGTVYDSGKVIFNENDTGDQMYIIQDGSVRISKKIGGKEHILAVLGKGDFFGEMAIVNQVSRTATATAVGTVRLLAFNREGFISMVEKNARIALNIIDKLCRRLQQADLQIQHLVKKNEKGLLGLNIYYAFAEGGMEKAVLDYHKLVRDLSLNLEIPQDHITEFIAALAKDRVVALEQSKLMLLDKERITAISEESVKKF